ncbi:hypothetical protein WME90_05120 [Sorangium sp. So ce375]|uniref:hypothetical protein n=1 Tax=Sorangium sp. So ce375 TaxID=3133306 RepID=UPI003F5BBA1E
MSQSRSHLVLVPGFAGFDILGSVSYYYGVTEVLRKAAAGAYRAPLSVHCFANVPTASVDTRAHGLLHWLADRFRKGVFYGDVGSDQRDCLHLVGHSTGGRDIKTLMLLLLAAAEQDQTVYGVPARTILESICSIQFLSTPHRGTNLAHVFRRWRPGVMSTAGVAHGLLSLAGQKNASVTARLARTALRTLGHSDGIARAALDTIDRFHAAKRDGLSMAEARSRYFDVLCWLLNVAEDTGAFDDLDPLSSSGATRRDAGHSRRRLAVSSGATWRRELAACAESARKTGKAGLLGAELEEDLSDYYRQKGIALRSIVTRAKRDPGGAFLGIFSLLYGITADVTSRPRVVEALGPSCAVPWLDDPSRSERLTPEMNDGIVNSVSMVYPDAAHSVLVDADHADVMGHYRFIDPEDGDGADPSYGGYDLLQSRSGFDQSQFNTLWQSIGEFAMASDRCATASRRTPAVVPAGAPAVSPASAAAPAPASAPAVTHFRAEPSDPEGGA